MAPQIGRILPLGQSGKTLQRMADGSAKSSRVQRLGRAIDRLDLGNLGGILGSDDIIGVRHLQAAAEAV